MAVAVFPQAFYILGLLFASITKYRMLIKSNLATKTIFMTCCVTPVKSIVPTTIASDQIEFKPSGPSCNLPASFFVVAGHGTGRAGCCLSAQWSHFPAIKVHLSTPILRDSSQLSQANFLEVKRPSTLSGCFAYAMGNHWPTASTVVTSAHTHKLDRPRKSTTWNGWGGIFIDKKQKNHRPCKSYKIRPAWTLTLEIFNLKLMEIVFALSLLPNFTTPTISFFSRSQNLRVWKWTGKRKHFCPEFCQFQFKLTCLQNNFTIRLFPTHNLSFYLDEVIHKGVLIQAKRSLHRVTVAHSNPDLFSRIHS